MTRFILFVTLIGASILLSACANPAADKTRAHTAEPVSESRATVPVESEKLAVRPENSKIEFIGSKVTGSERGSFANFSGTIDLVKDRAESSRVTVEIDMNSVLTEADGLADHLKTADFFDVSKYPKATFASTEIRASGEKGATHAITGNLELHGVKKAITFPGTITVDSSAVTVNSEFAINRKDFGIAYAGRTNDLIRDEVVLRFAIRAPRIRS